MFRGLTGRSFRVTSDVAELLSLTSTHHITGSLPAVTHLRVPVTEGSNNVSNISPLLQQVRTTWVVKRKYEKYEEEGKFHLMKHRYFIYDLPLIKNKNTEKKPPIKIIMLKSEETSGYGQPGEVIELKPTLARLFLLDGTAVYASPENIKKYGNLHSETDNEVMSRSSTLTAKSISLMVVNVCMNLEVPWKLEPWHIAAQMRRIGYYVPHHTITIPEKEITGPNLELENKEFLVKIMLNKKIVAPVRCRIHHIPTLEKDRLPKAKYEPWWYPAEPIFPEEAEALAALTKACPATFDTLPEDYDDEEEEIYYT